MFWRRLRTSAQPAGLAVLAWSLFALAIRADDWPQWLGPQRDGVWRETGILDKFPVTGPRVLWRAPVSFGYSGPAVAAGKVYITDHVRDGKVKVGSGVAGTERVLCLDAATGKLLWHHDYPSTYAIPRGYPAGPRTTPAIAGGKVYTLGAMGDLLCLDANDGKLLWSKNLPREYQTDIPGWGFAGQPLVDGQRLICLVGGQGACVVAFHKDTGKELWRALTAEEPGYAPPMIFDIAGRRRLIIWHPESVNSLDPETGKVCWSAPYGNRKYIKAGLTIPTPRLDGDKLFLTSFYNGSILFQLHGDKQPEVLWQGKSNAERPEATDGLHSIMPTPFIKDGYIYGVCSYGELRCLKEDSGQRLWATHKATTETSMRWGNAFLVEHRDRFILFNEKGDLIIARLTPQGYDEIDRAHILEPTNPYAGKNRLVIWSQPAFANRCVFARNDREIICVSMAKEP
jgi:outer membrane protein assembly factor BamB